MTGRLLCLFWLYQDGREFWGDLEKKNNKNPQKTLPGNNLFKWIGLFSCWSALLIVFERIKANHKLLSAAGKNRFTYQLINKMNSISKTYLGFSRPALHPLELMRVSSISIRAVLNSGLLNLVNTADTFFFSEVNAFSVIWKTSVFRVGVLGKTTAQYYVICS